MGEMRFPAIMGRGQRRAGRKGESFRSRNGITLANQPRKIWQQRSTAPEKLTRRLYLDLLHAVSPFLSTQDKTAEIL